jgi:glutaredoxin
MSGFDAIGRLIDPERSKAEAKDSMLAQEQHEALQATPIPEALQSLKRRQYEVRQMGLLISEELPGTAAVRQHTDTHLLVVFSGPMSDFYSKQVAEAIAGAGLDACIVEADKKIVLVLASMTGVATVPSVWIGDKYIGGCNDGPEAWMGMIPNLRNGNIQQWVHELEVFRSCGPDKKQNSNGANVDDSKHEGATPNSIATGEALNNTALAKARMELMEIYTEHAPGMMDVIEPMLKTYAGKEQELVDHVRTKYILGGG